MNTYLYKTEKILNLRKVCVTFHVFYYTIEFGIKFYSFLNIDVVSLISNEHPTFCFLPLPPMLSFYQNHFKIKNSINIPSTPNKTLIWIFSIYTTCIVRYT